MTAVSQTGWSWHKVMTAVPRFGRKRFFANSPQNERGATKTRVEWEGIEWWLCTIQDLIL